MELASRQKKHSGEYARLRAYGWLYAVCAAAFVIGLLFTAVFVAVEAADGGMAPFIERGDVVLYSRIAVYISSPVRGDAVLFEDADGVLCTGRIVGLPGEEVTVSGGRVYISGILLDESAYAAGLCRDVETLALGNGEYFILPDERASANVSDPSRLVISGKAIRGTAFLRVSPISRIALFE